MSSLPWRTLPAAALRQPLLEVTSARGALQMFHPVSSLLCTRVQGHLDAGMSDEWRRATMSIWQPALRLTVFNDWEMMTSYDSSARQNLTEWVIEHRAQFNTAWFCTSSRIVAMGVSVAGALTAVAGISMHAARDRAQFTSQLSQAIERP